MPARSEQHDGLDLRELDRAAASRYREGWERTESDFDDDPTAAVTEADLLIRQVMCERGYPFDHPDVVDVYRDAHAIAVSSAEGKATAEDLCRAMKRYRSLLERLLPV